MPYYDFKCDTCGFTAATKVPIESCNNVACPDCGNTLRIIIHPVPFIFKEKP